MEKMTAEQKNQVLFYSLVEQFRMQAWVSLGKIKNPATDKIERNLELARISIDMLRMLKDKTAGNLSKEEERLLTQTIADLQLNYVDEYEREKRQQVEKKTEAEKVEKETTEKQEKAPSTEEVSEKQTAENTMEESNSKKAETQQNSE